MTTVDQHTRTRFQLPAVLLILGQLLNIGVTQLHAGGDANDHRHIFEHYAEDGIWGFVHVGQFLAIALFVGGLVALRYAALRRSERADWLLRLGANAGIVALALHGALQAVDGVALKQAVSAWLNAPEAEQASRFASAETIRWLEWGMRSYYDFSLGLSLLLFGTAIVLNVAIPRAIGWLIAFSGLAYCGQGWIAGTDGFTSAQSIGIVAAWLLCIIWMTWLAIYAWGEPRSSRTEAARAPA